MWTRSAFVLAVGLLALAVAARPAGSSGVGVLHASYHGVWHNRHDRKLNVLLEDLTVATHARGKFTGRLGFVPISGSVSQGELTFSGKVSNPDGTMERITHGRGEISATGLWVLGSFDLFATDLNAEASGQYTFLDSVAPLTSLEERFRGGQRDSRALQTAYVGAYHDRAVASLENLDMDFLVTERPTPTTFVGSTLGITVRGRIDGDGKVTFSGRKGVMPNTLKVSAKGFLSATGLTLIGVATFTGTGNVRGTYTGTFDLLPPN